jgi:lipopolysaccharide transport system permease protein
VGSSNLISKIYFPRLIIPMASVGLALVDFAVSSLILLAMMAYYHVAFNIQLVWVPLFLFGTVLTATGVGTLLSALTVSYRDFRYVVPFLVQIWMFISPVIYPVNIVPAKWRWALSLNPMSGLIDGFRAVLGHRLDWPSLTISLVMGVVFFFLGAAYFRTAERHFADVI